MARSVLLALLLLSVSPSLLPAAPADSFEIRQVLWLDEHWPSRRAVCGDADHDSLPETWLLSYLAWGWEDVCFEFDGNSIVDSVSIGMSLALNFDLGDADRDGKTELLCADDSSFIPYYFLYESPDPWTLPATRVWQHAVGLASGKRGLIADLDADSAGELVLTDTGRLAISIFENVRDDEYELANSVPGAGLGDLVGIADAPDLDRDGRPELLVTTHSGYVLFYEYDDSNELRLRDTFEWGRWNRLNGIGTALDMDRDGRNEAVFFGPASEDTGTVLVVESPADDSFQIVWLDYVPLWGATDLQLAVGDIDGDGIEEFAVSGDRLRLFRCSGPDAYKLFWTGPSCGPEIGLYDLNRDGKAEIICHSGLSHTLIYEYFSLGVEELSQQRLMAELGLRQSHIRAGGVLKLPTDAAVTAHDAVGRLVAAPSGTWNTSGLAPGTYFLRVCSGSASAFRKLLLLP